MDDNPKNFVIFKVPTLEAAGALLQTPTVCNHTAVPFDGVLATITPLALNRIIVEKQAQPVVISPAVGLPGQIAPQTISILASSQHSAICEKYGSLENLSDWFRATLYILPNIFTEDSLPASIKALLESFSEPDFIYALGNNHKPYPGIVVTLQPELAAFLVANGLYYVEAREWKGPVKVEFLSNLQKSIKTGTSGSGKLVVELAWLCKIEASFAYAFVHRTLKWQLQHLFSLPKLLLPTFPDMSLMLALVVAACVAYHLFILLAFCFCSQPSRVAPPGIVQPSCCLFAPRKSILLYHYFISVTIVSACALTRQLISVIVSTLW